MAAVLGAGFSSTVLEDPNFDILRRNLDEAAELGVEFVELSLFTMDLIAGGRIIPSQLRRLKEALAGHDLRYTVHGPIAINFMQVQHLKRHLAVARATVEIAAEIGAVHLILHTGNVRAADDTAIEDAYAHQRDALASLGDLAAPHSLIVAVENVFAIEPDMHTALPSRLAREIEGINHPNVRACLDFSHGAINCSAQGADFLPEAKELARVAKHLHIHDSFGDPLQLRTVNRSERLAFGLGDLHLPIGWGSLPWQKMMSPFAFEHDVIFNLELPAPYWFALKESLGAMRGLIEAYQAGRSNT
ncbi:MAG: sugar phosphate isomerase/epimerase [Rhodomicrobium sp.]